MNAVTCGADGGARPVGAGRGTCRCLGARMPRASVPNRIAPGPPAGRRRRASPRRSGRTARGECALESVRALLLDLDGVSTVDLIHLRIKDYEKGNGRASLGSRRGSAGGGGLRTAARLPAARGVRARTAGIGPRIYAAALAAAGLPAGSRGAALFVDDAEANVAAAADMGLPAHRYRNLEGLRRWLAGFGLPPAGPGRT